MMPSQRVAEALVAAGLGGIGGNIFLERMPEEPQDSITCTTYGASAPDFTHDRAMYTRPMVQVAVRNTRVDEAYRIAEAAFRAVATVRNSGDVLEMRPMQSPFRITVDANERPRYIFNLAIMERVQ